MNLPIHSFIVKVLIYIHNCYSLSEISVAPSSKRRISQLSLLPCFPQLTPRSLHSDHMLLFFQQIDLIASCLFHEDHSWLLRYHSSFLNFIDLSEYSGNRIVPVRQLFLWRCAVTIEGPTIKGTTRRKIRATSSLPTIHVSGAVVEACTWNTYAGVPASLKYDSALPASIVPFLLSSSFWAFSIASITSIISLVLGVCISCKTFNLYLGSVFKLDVSLLVFRDSPKWIFWSLVQSSTAFLKCK